MADPLITELAHLLYTHICQLVDVLRRLEGLLRLLILVELELGFAEAKERLLGGIVAAMSSVFVQSARLLEHRFGLAPVLKS